MPQELPGFFYDAEKNRYFPLKGPIPGSSRPSSSSSSASDRQNPKQKTSQADNYCRTRVKTHRLLQGRELNGNVVSLSKSKYNFVQEYQKAQASKPVVWSYQDQGSDLLACDGGLDETSFCVQTPDGQVNVDLLVALGLNSCLSVIEVGNGGQAFHRRINHVMPDRVWPLTVGGRTDKSPEHLVRITTHFMSSSISSVKLLGRTSHPSADMGSHIQNCLYPLCLIFLDDLLLTLSEIPRVRSLFNIGKNEAEFVYLLLFLLLSVTLVQHCYCVLLLLINHMLYEIYAFT